MRSAWKQGGVALAAAGLAVGGFAYAALHPESQIFGDVLIAGRDANELALTFDDGPNPSATRQILAALAEARVRATFFLIGAFVKREPGLAREIAGAGHLVGNHSMTHPRLVWQSAERVRQELRGTNDLLEDVLGVPVRYFRPPHGARRPYVLRAAAELELTTVQWNVTASDWNPIGVPTIVRNVHQGIARNTRRGRGSNVLLHDGGHLEPAADRRDTVLATRQILRAYTHGRFVTVDAWARAAAML